MLSGVEIFFTLSHGIKLLLDKLLALLLTELLAVESLELGSHFIDLFDGLCFQGIFLVNM